MDWGWGISRAGRYDTTKACIFGYAFLGTYDVAIFEDVLGQVDVERWMVVGESTVMFYLLDGLFDGV